MISMHSEKLLEMKAEALLMVGASSIVCCNFFKAYIMYDRACVNLKLQFLYFLSNSLNLLISKLKSQQKPFSVVIYAN